MIRNRRFLITIIAISLIALAAIAYADLQPGTKAPSFTLSTIDGKTFTLADNFKDHPKVVVMDIWATWCPPCKMEIPYLIDLSKNYKGKDVTFVGIAIDEKLDTVKSFAKEKGITYTVVHDSMAGKVGSAFTLRHIPMTYVIDKKGDVRFVHSGFPASKAEQQNEAAKLKSEVDKLLAEK